MEKHLPPNVLHDGCLLIGEAEIEKTMLTDLPHTELLAFAALLLHRVREQRLQLALAEFELATARATGAATTPQPQSD